MSVSIIQAPQAFGNDWPKHLNLPKGSGGFVSAGGWTLGNEGFIQQTFLGASIRSFDVSAGFGNTTSSLSVSLVDDEHNRSDGTLIGNLTGDDIYHDGKGDKFNPPPVGSPVFFKFGKNFASIRQAWSKSYDNMYGDQFGNLTPNPQLFPEFITTGPIIYQSPYTYLKSRSISGGVQTNTWVDKSALSSPTNMSRGKDHFVFGGILQSYTQNRGPDGNPVYSVTVQDPREILSNVVLILDDYAGSTYGLNNVINIYGFLEYDPSDTLQVKLDLAKINRTVLTKVVDPFTFVVSYLGTLDLPALPNTISSDPLDCYNMKTAPALGSFAKSFPITGQGFARKSENGIPLYRINQALEALFESQGVLPAEYKDNAFGGIINFRGHRYIVDLTGLSLDKIPHMYNIKYSQIDLLSLLEEVCDTVSHDLYVSLIPILSNHPFSAHVHNINQAAINAGNTKDIIDGIIRIDIIDRSKAPTYGVITQFIDDLKQKGIDTSNQDVGFEVSNVVTDKFIAGAQEVNMYVFNNNKDRDHLELRKKKAGNPDNKFDLLQTTKWDLKTSLSQQILPFYGFIGKDVPTIPRGFGSFQQIMLDSSSVNAYGVGNYYVATELELRAAAVSYEAWSNFLCLYDERYVSRVDDGAQLAGTLSAMIPATDAIAQDQAITNLINGGEYAVDVPRCVFNSEQPRMGTDGYPASPCSPPYGYPLYYKRAEKIGIPQAGVIELLNIQKRMISNLNRSKEVNKSLNIKINKYKEEIDRLEKRKKDIEDAEMLKQIQTAIEDLIKMNKAITDELNNSKQYSALKTEITSKKVDFRNIDRLGKESLKNSMKVYSFLKDVADKYLGKTFLVKIPKVSNLNYKPIIKVSTILGGFVTPSPDVNNIIEGPFGFKPLPIHLDINFGDTVAFKNQITALELANKVEASNPINNFAHFEHYLRYEAIKSKHKYTGGALKNNFNPILEKWEFNYSPEPQGGFFDFDLVDKNLSFIESQLAVPSVLPLATRQLLIPKDFDKFVNDNRRIEAYVRYNHSEVLNFKNVSQDSLTQEIITDAGGFIPDIMGEIDNFGNDTDFNMNFDPITNQLDPQNKKPAVAFVKCSLDDKFYMAPKLRQWDEIKVFGRTTSVIKMEPNIRYVEITKADGCKELVKTIEITNIPLKPGLSADDPNASDDEKGGSDGTFVTLYDFDRKWNSIADAFLVDTSIKNLDPDNVYCLITVNGKVEPAIDARYLDGPYQALNNPQLKNLMLADVVNPNVAGFDLPATKGKAINVLTDILCQKKEFTPETLNAAIASANLVIKGRIIAEPEINLNYTSPSPVYPDYVILPLMSHERCYGPWISSMIKFNPLSAPTPWLLSPDQALRKRNKDLGGKIEFNKDELLAPWNYGGFKLMNEAGALKAQFSNSLMLSVERGGFVIPEAPTGISIARALKLGGPLVTSISVSVSDSNISTTVKMDLYTARFGKLQKHKEEAISQIVRQKQKSTDERNALIRKGFIKSGSSKVNYTEKYNDFAPLLQLAVNNEKQLTKLEEKKNTPNLIVASIKTENGTNKKLNDGKDMEISTNSLHVGITTATAFQETLSTYDINNPTSMSQDLFNSAGGHLSDVFKPYSSDVYHPNMASIEYSNEGAYNILEQV